LDHYTFHTIIVA